MSALTTAADTALSQTTQHFRHLDLTLPEDLTADLTELDETLTAPAALRHDPGALVEAVAAALAAGKDPAKDAAVRDALTREQLHKTNIGERLRAAHASRRAALVVRYGPAIIETMRPTVEAADERLAAARRAIPNLDLVDVNFVSRLRPSQMTVWGEAREALANVQRVSHVWSLVAAAAGLARVDNDKRPLILADLTTEQLAALNPDRGQKAEVVVHAGHRLSLASVEEFHARCERVDQQRARLAAEAEQQEKAAQMVGRL